jgi:fatty acid/phospholipid biosynthesis enzyme
VIAHGNSSSHAIANAIRTAATGVEHRIVERLSESLPERVVASARSSDPNPN